MTPSDRQSQSNRTHSQNGDCFIHSFIHSLIHSFTYVCVFMYVCSCVCAFMCVFIYVYVDVHVCMLMCMCVCAHAHTRVHALVSFSVAVTNILTKSNLGKRGFLWFTIPGSSLLFWTNRGRNLKNHIHSQEHREETHGFLLTEYSVFSTLRLQGPAEEINVLPTIGWVFLHQLVIKTRPPKAHRTNGYV